MVETSTVASEAITATKTVNVLEHIKGRRIEYLLGTLIAHQMGLLDAILVYGHGVCF